MRGTTLTYHFTSFKRFPVNAQVAPLPNSYRNNTAFFEEEFMGDLFSNGDPPVLSKHWLSVAALSVPLFPIITFVF